MLFLINFYDIKIYSILEIAKENILNTTCFLETKIEFYFNLFNELSVLVCHLNNLWQKKIKKF